MAVGHRETFLACCRRVIVAAPSPRRRRRRSSFLISVYSACSATLYQQEDPLPCMYRLFLQRVWRHGKQRARARAAPRVTTRRNITLGLLREIEMSSSCRSRRRLLFTRQKRKQKKTKIKIKINHCQPAVHITRRSLHARTPLISTLLPRWIDIG